MRHDREHNPLFLVFRLTRADSVYKVEASTQCDRYVGRGDFESGSVPAGLSTGGLALGTAMGPVMVIAVDSTKTIGNARIAVATRRSVGGRRLRSDSHADHPVSATNIASRRLPATGDPFHSPFRGGTRFEYSPVGGLKRMKTWLPGNATVRLEEKSALPDLNRCQTVALTAFARCDWRVQIASCLLF